MDIAQLLLPDFALILCGYLLCRFSALDQQVWQPIERLVYYFLFPLLLFQALLRSPLEPGAALRFMGAGLSGALLAIALAYSLPHWPLLGQQIERRAHAASAQVAFRFNSFIALALAERLAGTQGLLLIALLMGVCIPLFNIAAVWPMARHAQRGLAREIVRNPLVIATGCGLAANMLGLSIPGWLQPLGNRLGSAALTLGLLAAGAGLQLASLAQGKALAVALLGIRHAVLPLLAWSMARLWGLDAVQGAVLLAFAALPTSSSCYVLAARMGYDGAYVAALVTLSTLLALVSLPLALAYLR